jgi:hypothetical protein
MAAKKQNKRAKSQKHESIAKQEQKDLLGFLKDAKHGKYAKIDPHSLRFVRQPEESYSFTSEDDYVFSVR